MARGDYTVQEVEALKQAGRDSSFRTCIVTMLIFLAMCIILLLITWATWKPTRDKDAYSSHSKYSGRQHTTESPVTISKEPTTMKTGHEKRKTTPTTGTSRTTESNLIKLVASDTTATITATPATSTTTTTTKKPLKQPVVLIPLTTTEKSSTQSTASTTESILVQHIPTTMKQPSTTTTPATSTSTTTITTTEKPLKQPVVLIPSTTTEKSLTQSSTASTTESILVQHIPTTMKEPSTTTTPATSATTTTTEKPLKQPVVLIPSTTTEKSLTQSSTASTTESILVQYIPTTMKQPSTTKTSTQDETSEQPQSTTTEKLFYWSLATNTSVSTTEHPNTTIPSLAHSDPDSTSTSEETTPLVQHTESTTSRTESPRPEDQTTQKHSSVILVYREQSSTQSTTSLTRSTVTESLESQSTDEPFAVAASAGSDSETTNLPVNNLTRPATTDSSPTTVPMSVNKQSASTATNENVTSYSSTATIKFTIRDRSTTLVNATTDTTDSESTTPTSVLAYSSSSGPCAHPHSIMTANNYSTNCTSASTSLTTSTIISGNDSSDPTNFYDDLSSEFTPTVQPINITSSISTITGGPIYTNSEETSSTSANTTATTGVTPVTLTQHSTAVSGVTTIPIPLDKSISNATVFPEKHSHCNSSACKVVSSRMLSLMNHSADPCEDFYEFACGGLRENRNLLQHDPVDEVWTRIAGAVKRIDAHSPKAFQKFNNFYDQCLMFDSIVNKTHRLEEVRKVLDNVGKMYNYSGWTAGNFNLNITSLLVKLFKLNSAPLFDVQLDVDIHNTSKFLLKLIPPTHQSKFQTESSFAAQCKNRIVPQDQKHVNLKNIYFNKYLPCTRDYGGYMNLIEKALKELGMLKDLGPFYEGQYIKDLRFFIEFHILTHLTELPDTGQMRHILLTKQFKSMSVDDLQTKYPLVDWKTLLSALVGDTINSQTTIQLYFNDYFDHLFDKLNNDFRADDKNRMNMHNALLAMFAHDLYADLVETQSPCAREDYCLKVASGLLEDVSSALYLSTFTREQLNAMEFELQTLFTQLKFTLQEDFQEAEWMDDPSRSYVTSKLQRVIAIADGGRGFLGNSNLLDERLSEVDMNSSNNYLQNAVQLLRHYRNGMYSFYSSQPNLTDTIWSHFLLPYDTRAIAVYQLNIVVIPFGLIGSPPTSDLPAYIFKARVGNDLARQIAHHFDFTGIDYGSNGKDNNLLSDTSRDWYKATQECVKNLYAFEKTWTNHKHQIFTFEVDPSQSMTERFADSSALQLSYKTFKRTTGSEPLLPWLDMSYEKLYHMLVAQEFCTKGGMMDYTIQLYESEQIPPFLRVTNLVQNSEEFAQAFSCGRGTEMNPPVKCDPFPKITIEDNVDNSKEYEPQ